MTVARSGQQRVFRIAGMFDDEARVFDTVLTAHTFEIALPAQCTQCGAVCGGMTLATCARYFSKSVTRVFVLGSTDVTLPPA